MQNKHTLKIIAGVALVVLLALVGFRLFKEETPAQPASETGSTVPDLDRKVEVLVQLHPFVEAEALKGLASTTEALRENPDDHLLWVTLGVFRKTLGDYQEAKDIWLYVAKRWPLNYVAYNNLGNLYHIELKDFAASEKAYQMAATVQPRFVQTYINLYELYRYSYPGKKALAPDPLKVGLSRNPNDLNLNLTLARYYVEMGDLAAAKPYFEKSIAVGGVAKAASLRAEAKEAGIEL